MSGFNPDPHNSLNKDPRPKILRERCLHQCGRPIIRGDKVTLSYVMAGQTKVHGLSHQECHDAL